MMYPDMMHVMVETHHEYLRSLMRDSILDELGYAGRLLRRGTGQMMVRTGEWLAGYTPQSVTPKPKVTVQQP